MKGILFKPWKIQFIAEHPAIELQTRRLGGLKTINAYPDEWELAGVNSAGEFIFGHLKTRQVVIIKPRYQVGETVYIKEGLRRKWNDPQYMPCHYITYTTDLTPVTRMPPDEKYAQFGRASWRWERDKVNPMMMPEWAARHFITITDVRAERLQGISPQDVRREGINPLRTDFDQPINRYEQIDREKFIKLWNSINKDYPWEMNPWVWVYTFRLEGKGEER